MAPKNGSNYDMSKDYQLPTGKLWWLVIPLSEQEAEHVRIFPTMLFTWDDANTWYQAKQRADILIREDYPEYIAKNGKLPAYRLMLWEGTTQNSIVLQ